MLCKECISGDQNYGYFFGIGKAEEELFDVDKLEKYLFNETHTYTRSFFEEKFVRSMEKEERLIPCVGF